jgi:hypothetical protein
MHPGSDSRRRPCHLCHGLIGGARAAVILFMAILVVPASVRAEPHAGQMLRDALIELNEQGAALVFSSEVVSASMHVEHTPAPADPIETAREILAPHGLALVPGPNGRWLVTRATKKPPNTRVSAEDDPRSESAQSELDEVLVLANRYRLYGSGSSTEFKKAEIERLPHLADDLMRAIARLPAVASDDFSARINLRGGAREETTLYLDGLELIDPFHLKDLQGALSIVDSNLVDRMDLLPGGFPVTYGDSASGVVDIRTLPTPEENVYSLGVSFINAFANGRGTFDDQRGGWLVSIRRGYLDWLFKLIDTGEGVFSPRYLDFLVKVEHDVGDLHAVSAHVLVADDDLTYLDDSENTTVGGRAKSIFIWTRLASQWRNDLRSETIVWRSGVERRREVAVADPDNIDADLFDVRDLRILGIRSDWQWNPYSDWMFSFGAELDDKRVDYDYRLSSVTTAPEYPAQPSIDRRSLLSIDGRTAGVYVSARRDFGRLVAELGYRWDAERYTGHDQNVSGPRLNARYEFTPTTRLLLAWGDYYQFQPVEALQVEDGVETFGEATYSRHVMLGLQHRFRSGLYFNADMYTKRYLKLRPRFTNLFDSYEPIPEAEPDRYQVNAATAEARGLEIVVKRPSISGLSWWASYTYARTEDRIQGVDIAREWDQPHALRAVLNWQGANWNFNLASSWHSGWPRTEAELGTVDTPSGPQLSVVPGQRNAARYADYFRVDTRISRDVHLKRGTFTYFFEIYNLFDTQNPCCIDEVSINPGPELRISEDNWLPRMPSFGFRWTFS